MNKAWEPFKYWLASRSIEQLQNADAAALALSYAPIPAEQLAQMIAIKLRALSKAKR
ncbi:MAG: hypothetical protein ACRCYS_11825 [Beijerinckiaceae bacterium]